ncbi:MAG: helix-turn-helix domain-containing protein [Minicystis sp.]
MRGQVGHSVARALMHLGRLGEARRVLDTALADGERGSVRFDVGRAIRFAHLALTAEAGDLARARAEMEAIEPYIGPASLHRPYLLDMRATVDLAAGDLGAFNRTIAGLDQPDVPPRVAEDVATLKLRARVLRRSPPNDADRSTHEASARFTGTPRLHLTELLLRTGARAPADVIRDLDRPIDNPDALACMRMVHAQAALLGGDPSAAQAELTAAITDTHEAGYALREVEVRQLLCDVLLVRRAGAALAAAATDLARMAEAMPSARFRHAATLHGLAAAGALDPGVIEALAAAGDAAPDTAIRARMLLGAEGIGDAVDRLVVGALVAETGWRAPNPVTGTPAAGARWTPGWGLDEARMAVWLPAGSTLDLTGHPVLWRLLLCLADHGGAADKERIVRRVWDERDYHPLRHDNRLQAAVRKLRRRLEDDASAPARLVTTSEGYALGGVVRRLRARR